MSSSNKRKFDGLENDTEETAAHSRPFKKLRPALLTQSAAIVAEAFSAYDFTSFDALPDLELEIEDEEPQLVSPIFKVGDLVQIIDDDDGTTHQCKIDEVKIKAAGPLYLVREAWLPQHKLTSVEQQQPEAQNEQEQTSEATRKPNDTNTTNAEMQSAPAIVSTENDNNDNETSSNDVDDDNIEEATDVRGVEIEEEGEEEPAPQPTAAAAARRITCRRSARDSSSPPPRTPSPPRVRPPNETEFKRVQTKTEPMECKDTESDIDQQVQTQAKHMKMKYTEILLPGQYRLGGSRKIASLNRTNKRKKLKKIKCWTCHQKGHSKRFCPSVRITMRRIHANIKREHIIENLLRKYNVHVVACDRLYRDKKGNPRFMICHEIILENVEETQRLITVANEGKCFIEEHMVTVDYHIAFHGCDDGIDNAKVTA